MKVKTYLSPTLPEAMETIRRDFGDDAVILSTNHTPEGVRVLIATESLGEDALIYEALFGGKEDRNISKIKDALLYHRVPDILIERMLLSVQNIDGDDADALLQKAISKTFSFSPLAVNTSNRAFMFVGMSGAGKTIAVAKTAVKAKINGEKIAVITADMKRAGAIEQLAAFTKILELDLIKVRTPDQLQAAVDALRPTHSVIIDTPGVNPYNKSDMEYLRDLKSTTAGLEPVLVMSAGMDAFESADAAECFAEIGCKRLLVSRTDLVRRMGGVLFAASANNLHLSDAGTSPNVAEGLAPLTPASLSKIILKE